MDRAGSSHEEPAYPLHKAKDQTESKNDQENFLQESAGTVNDGVRSSCLVLTLLLFGVIQFGLVFNNYLTMTDAVRAGARKEPSDGTSDPQGEATAAVRAAATDLRCSRTERQRQRISPAGRLAPR